MKTPKFKNKDNSLTPYAFACGYLQRFNSSKTGNSIELYMEHDHYHLRWGKTGQKFHHWLTFEWNELTKAKRLYNRFVRLQKINK